MGGWKVFAVASAFFAGLTALLGKVGVQGINSNFATFIRTLVVLVFLIILLSVRGEWFNPFLINRRSLLFLVFSALATGLSWVFYYRALQSGPASLVAAIDKTSLVFAVLLAVLFLAERPNLYQWLGIVLIAIGTLLSILK